ncbi:unnamed protein product [Fusarium graminearum]|nr:unnamed protein product [Fusarium graminearum]
MHVEQPLPDVVAVCLDTGFAENMSTREDIFRNLSHTAKTSQIALEPGNGAINSDTLVEFRHYHIESPRYSVLVLIKSVHALVEVFDLLVNLSHPLRKEGLCDKRRLV